MKLTSLAKNIYEPVLKYQFINIIYNDKVYKSREFIEYIQTNFEDNPIMTYKLLCHYRMQLIILDIRELEKLSNQILSNIIINNVIVEFEKLDKLLNKTKEKILFEEDGIKYFISIYKTDIFNDTLNTIKIIKNGINKTIISIEPVKQYYNKQILSCLSL